MHDRTARRLAAPFVWLMLLNSFQIRAGGRSIVMLPSDFKLRVRISARLVIFNEVRFYLRDL